MLPIIQTHQELLNYLNTANNPYTCFINEKLKCAHHDEYACNNKKIFEQHHIIPLHAKGPNKKWNLILLTLTAHQKAHELLYHVYKQPGDLCALNFRKNLIKKAYLLKIKMAHHTQKINKLSFYNSEIQRKNGQKGGKIQTKNKLKKYREKVGFCWNKVLGHKTIWWYKPTNKFLIINGNNCFLPKFFGEKFFEYKPFSKIYKAKKQSFVSCLARVLKKERHSASGWFFIRKLKKSLICNL
jgi:hypothetical protein